jgi:CDP-diacylglycerol---glycerol-3-phosphate 3-phosphatidyltransferase
MTISIYQLKPKFQRLLAPLLSGLMSLRVTPNQITLFTLCLSLGYGLALACFPQRLFLFLGLPFFLLLRMALNAIDGMLANASNQKTPLGALLNEIADQLADVALYLPFALVPGISAPLAALTVIAGLLAEFAGVLALSIGVPRRFDGPMGKSDRAFAYGLLALLMAAGVADNWLNALLSAVLILSLWTIVNRLRQALRISAPPTP